MLGASESPLVQTHDVVMLDLDGVVYAGGHAVDGAVPALQAARRSGTRLAFVTNNASRPPEAVAQLLTSLQVPAEVTDVVTSAQAAAAVLAERYPAGAKVLVLGGPGLVEALRGVGLVPVTGADDPDVIALATGYGPEVVWRDVMAAGVRIREGLPWIASNTDWTIPTPQGIAPGHGVMVRMLSDFAGVEPTVAGKPAPPLLEETIARTRASRPLMVGDRLDTDISGARALDIDSLLVMTGVSDLAVLADARPEERPTYLSADLSGLLTAHSSPVRHRPGDGSSQQSAGAAEWTLGGWTATVLDGRLEVSGRGGADDWWRVAAVTSWDHRDRSGTAADVEGLVPPSAGSVGADR